LKHKYRAQADIDQWLAGISKGSEGFRISPEESKAKGSTPWNPAKG
jgi:hypothetical protein